MSSNAITEKDDSLPPRPGGGDPYREVAPSVLREDQTMTPFVLGMIGAALVLIGALGLGMNIFGGRAGLVSRIPTGWALFLLTMGLCGLLFHAAFERDLQLRFVYMVFGFVALGVGVVLCFLPYPAAMGDQLRWGVFLLGVALLFLLAFLRNETREGLRNLSQLVLGGTGAALTVVGLAGGNLRGEFLLPLGVVFALLGLVYLAAFVGTRGISDDLAYLAAVGLAGVGTLAILVVLARSLFAAGGSRYFVSHGVILLFVGLLYLAVGCLMAIDWPVFIMTRRELGSFFYSPIAYLTLLAFSVSWWTSYYMFLGQLVGAEGADGPAVMTEPIILHYFFSLIPVFMLLAMVPVLTMRLLSEEKRAGTLEVLLTAPVDEPAIVMSKFLSALIVYLVMWVPAGLFLLAIPLGGGAPFDYRPMLSFGLVVVTTGAGFVSMGLFFSSLTQSQIASFMLTFAGMVALLVVSLLVMWGANIARDASWQAVLTHTSFLHLWRDTLEGKIVPRFLLFPASMTVLFLFMTVKVLEARKWS